MTQLATRIFAALCLVLTFAAPSFADDFSDGNAAYDRGDYVTAMRLLRGVAEGGHDGAMNRVGYMYANGMGVPRDDAEAVRWYRMAAEKGNGFAQSNLGFMYDAGRGVPEDDVEAVRWYRLAAEKGNASAQGNLGVMYRHGYGVPQDDVEAVRWYRLAADQGNANAQRNLGYSYQQGTGVAQDYTEAVKWYRKAADQGNLNAINDMGVMYKNGWGVPKDDAESVRWYRMAAEKGHAHAMNNLARAYVDGRAGEINLVEAYRLFQKVLDTGETSAHETARTGIADLPDWVKTGGTDPNAPVTPKTTTTTTTTAGNNDFADGNAAYDRGDYVTAMRLLRGVAEGGHDGAMNRVGYMYANGMGVPRDDVEAVRWYRMAAEKGNGFAQSNLGFMYDAGRGVPEDDVEAVRWYKLAADKGNASAQGNLGVMYRHGYGVEKDDVEAVRWYRLAADQGNANAQRNLGYSYQQGTGVAQDYTEALKWYRKAADQGNLNAINDMGVMYKNGWGVPQDDAESVRWYRMAAEKGHAHAQNNLGRAYVDGRAGEINLVEAYRLFQLAARSSDKSAVDTANKAIADLPEWVRTGGTDPNKTIPSTPTTTTPQDRPRPNTVPNAPARIMPSCGGADIPSIRTEQRRVALVIGISEYQHVTPLPNPTCDAKAMAATLQKAGFEVVEGYDLDKSGLEQKARDFVRIAANADVALFFYAGHGLQVDGINYMVPVDAKVEDATAIRFELMDMDSITAFMSGPNKVGIILLDACRDNPFAAKLKRSLSRSTNVGAGLAAIRNEGGGLVIGFATSPGDVAADGIGQHSPFTTALLEELPTVGLDFELVMREVKARVVELTSHEITPQRPWTNSDLTTAFVFYPN